MNASERECRALLFVAVATAALIAMAMLYPQAQPPPIAAPAAAAAAGARRAEGENLFDRIVRVIRPSGAASAGGRGDPAGLRTAAFDPVSDPQTVMTDQDEREISRYMRDIQQAAGVPAAVVTLRSTGGRDAHRLAATLFDRWEPARRNRGKGLLLLFVAEPPHRGIIVESGSGLEEAAAEAIRRMLRQQPLPPYPENAVWREGVVSGVRSVRDYLAGRRRGALRSGPVIAEANHEEYRE